MVKWKSLLGWIKSFKKKNNMEDKKKKEVFITGVVSSHPIPTFSDLHNGGSVMGWVFKLKTTQLIGYEYKEVVININVVYDMKKWNILKKGQTLTLSVLRKQESGFTDDGVALKCNVVNRK